VQPHRIIPLRLPSPSGRFGTSLWHDRSNRSQIEASLRVALRSVHTERSSAGSQVPRFLGAATGFRSNGSMEKPKSAKSYSARHCTSPTNTLKFLFGRPAVCRTGQRIFTRWLLRSKSKNRDGPSATVAELRTFACSARPDRSANSKLAFTDSRSRWTSTPGSQVAK